MKKLLALGNHPWAKDVGLLVLRVGIGILLIIHGSKKIMGGYEQWLWLGNQMAHFDITVFPVFWGICATATEFLGGFALMFGLGTRIACLFLSFNMIVALVYHVSNGDAYQIFSHPLALLCVFISIFIAGAGRFSLDQKFWGYPDDTDDEMLFMIEKLFEEQ